MSQEIKVSVIIPCYNHGAFVEEAVASVQVGKHPICEVIVVNDGSDDDNTEKVVSSLETERITVIHQKNKGLSAARNVGICMAKGEYILLLDADNLIDTQYFIQAIKILDSNPETAIVYSDHYRFGKDLIESVYSVPPFSSDRLLAGNFIDACAVFRKSIIDVVGEFDESGMVGFEDWEFWIRCWSKGLKFEHIPEPLFKYRVVEGSMLSQVNQHENRRKTTAYIINKHQNLYQKNASGTIMYYLDFLMHNEELVKSGKKEGRALESEIQRLLENDEKLQDFLKIKDAEAVQLADAVEKKETHIQNLEEQISRDKISIVELQDTVERYSAQIQELKGTIEDKENQIKNIDNLITELNRKFDETSFAHESKVVEYNLQIDRLIAEKTKNIADLELQTEQLKQLNSQNEKALGSIFQLQSRINRIESSKPFKFYKQLRHFKNLFKSNYSGNQESNIFKKFVFMLGKKGRSILKRFLAKIFKHLYLWTEERQVYIVEADQIGQHVGGDAYNQWLSRHLPTESTLITLKKEMDGFVKRPKFSIVMPVYNPSSVHFRAAMESVLAQIYPDWELCLSDDNSSNKEVKKIIKEYQKRDSRIKAVFRKENGHIAAASNSGLDIATGDYIVLMDQDDLITTDALYHNALVINSNNKVDLIYSDEDKVDDNAVHSYPHFKPDWSPDNLLSRNYLGHLTVFSADIFKEIGGWRLGYDGSQDHDLVLRFVEKTDAVFHIPRVLYHWRMHAASAASGEEAKPYAYIAAKKALTEALVRRDEPGTVDFLDGFRGYSIRYDLKSESEKVSIVIPTKDKADYLERCIDSVFEKSTYQNFEVIVVDNNSSEKSFFQLMDVYTEKYKGRFQCVRAEIPFNFSSLVNLGAEQASGKFLVLLNNDTEVISEDWLEGMMEQAQRPSIGVVGVKLMYENQTIQHAGVVMGLGGAAGHVLVGEDRHGPGHFNYVNLTNNYSAVTAACIMIRKQLYDKLKGFDEEFSVEYNDVDFCLRVRESGFNNIYVPHVELFHYESISRGHPHATNESYARHIQEIGKLKDRWTNYIDHDPCYNPNQTLGAHDFSLRH
ncbi:MAG: glycosyltransferase involved in cell wall biosynthesis [Granulosicoccus sp.]|jgi:glycosyltransferase involved in cell wall biosynthesis